MKLKQTYLVVPWLAAAVLALYSLQAVAHSPTIRLARFEDCGIPVDIAKEVMVVNPHALEDARANPGGPWHFSSLVRQMLPADATEKELSDLLLRWLQRSKTTKIVNGFDLLFPGFALGERTICRWVEELGGKQCNADNVNPSRIPYKLIAIVNRVDLDGHGPDQAEGRFIFAGLNKATNHPATDSSVHASLETVIFEYQLPLTGDTDLKSWAKAWHVLGQKSCTSAQDCEPYRQALQTITDKFSSRDLVAGKPNGNSLGQIRTSHLAPGSGTLWAFSEFRLEGQGRNVDLVLSPTGQTPHHGLDNSKELADWITQNADAIVKEKHIVPRSFLSGQTILDDTQAHQWHLPAVETSLRQAFSQQTCNGCHGERKVTDGFFHVSPVSPGNQGQDRLSAYLVDEQLPQRAQFMKKLLCER